MGRIVGAFATSHSPGITGFPEMANEEQRNKVYRAFEQVRKELEAARPDALVCISVEHFTSFFLNNYPAFCIGIADSYVGPPTPEFERFLRVETRTFPGHAALGTELLKFAYREGFDPSFSSGDMAFDENFCVPFHFLLPGDDLVPLVPIIVNGVQPPLPTRRRCYEFGRMLARAIESQTVADRVAILATGGLSHWVGAPESGQINTDWDQRVMELLSQGRAEEITEWSDEEVEAAGNGAEEIRTWLMLAGAVHGRKFRFHAYEPIPPWLTGTAVASVEL
jgi:protocatechuate 4,5-dioxygenase beta chain/2,3-dihydroxyphenylpropionate 1,2-dioxygenase